MVLLKIPIFIIGSVAEFPKTLRRSSAQALSWFLKTQPPQGAGPNRIPHCASGVGRPTAPQGNGGRLPTLAFSNSPRNPPALAFINFLLEGQDCT